MADELFNEEVFTLTDEEGNEKQFELLGSQEIDGNTYLALVPVEDNENEEYVILKVEEDENGEPMLAEVEDEALLDRLAAIFEAHFDEMYADDEEDGDAE